MRLSTIADISTTVARKIRFAYRKSKQSFSIKANAPQHIMKSKQERHVPTGAGSFRFLASLYTLRDIAVSQNASIKKSSSTIPSILSRNSGISCPDTRYIYLWPMYRNRRVPRIPKNQNEKSEILEVIDVALVVVVE